LPVLVGHISFSGSTGQAGWQAACKKYATRLKTKKAKLGIVAFLQSKYSIILKKYPNWVKSTPKYSILLMAGETTPFSMPRRQLFTNTQTYSDTQHILTPLKAAVKLDPQSHIRG
jgi:hypothetical protein